MPALLLVGIAACGGSNDNQTNAREIVVQPEVRHSTDGLLNTTLEAVIATNTVLDVSVGL